MATNQPGPACSITAASIKEFIQISASDPILNLPQLIWVRLSTCSFWCLFPLVSFNKNQVKISLHCLFHSEATVLANLLPVTASIQSNLGGWWGVCYYWNMSSSVQSSKSWLTISLIHLQCTRTKKQLTNRNDLKVSLSRMGTEAIRLDK